MFYPNDNMVVVNPEKDKSRKSQQHIVKTMVTTKVM